VLGGPRTIPPSEKVNIALVGAGGQGRHNVRALFQEPDAQVIAVADPIEQSNLDAFYYKGAGGRVPVRDEIEKHYRAKTPSYRCAEYEDFRVMLEKEKSIDAVLCATPDHLHAYVTLRALREGKHVYCEKPLTHNIHEARLVARTAKECGAATQMGNSGHSRDGMRMTCEWIWDGVIGPIHEVHAWVGYTQRWNKGLTGRPQETPPVPRGINWDLWLGPREPRPYHPAYTPVTWRDFWAFGTGGLGDFGCHDLDAAFWALQLDQPVSVDSRPAGDTNEEIAPYAELCHFHFPARGGEAAGGRVGQDRAAGEGPPSSGDAGTRKRGDKGTAGGPPAFMPPVKVTWYDGGLKPDCPEEMGPGRALPDRGILFVGEKGLLLAEGAGGPPRLLPAEKTRQYRKPPATLLRSKGHHRDWLDACKGGPPASANFDYSSRLTEVVLLAVLSLRLGKKIYWDPVAMKATDAPEAEPLVRGGYRKGWEL
jgi:predicted dehydrogenase